ncbi:MAG: carboxyl transferase domain-containing protein [Bryobacterales bacterium]
MWIAFLLTHEDVTKDRARRLPTHNEISGVAHFLAPDDKQCLRMVRELLSFPPSNNAEDPPVRLTDDPADRADARLDLLVPAESNKPYDIKQVIEAVADNGYFFEVQPGYAANIVVGFARLEGRPVGIVANQPAVLAGCLDINASLKAARFVRFAIASTCP